VQTSKAGGTLNGVVLSFVVGQGGEFLDQTIVHRVASRVDHAGRKKKKKKKEEKKKKKKEKEKKERRVGMRLLHLCHTPLPPLPALLTCRSRERKGGRAPTPPPQNFPRHGFVPLKRLSVERGESDERERE